jgi:hypothetical protein
MGGVAGGMDHLYDNPNLTFGEMKEILDAASNGELDTEEKVDGQNLFLSYSIPEGKAKGARNKGNLRQGGLDATGLAHKFAGRGGLEKAFTRGFAAFEKAVQALTPQEKKRLFGPNTNIWYNAEVMDPGTEGDASDPGAINVIKYDNKTLKIHDVGHFVFDRDTGEKSPIPKGTLEVLDNAYDRMQNALYGRDFSLARRAIINLQKLENDQALNTAKSAINSTMAAEGLSDNNTVQDYVFNRLINGIETDMSQDYKIELVKYLLGLPGNIGKRSLKKGLKPEDVQELEDIIRHKRMYLLQAIEPIEFAIHDFTVALLKGLKSVFIADTGKEVERLKKELSNAVNTLTAQGPDNPEAMNVMQRQLNKIKDFTQITTPVEAVVFDYNGHTYKFAGNFAPLNQILGMFKYPKGPRKITNENIDFKTKVVTEENGRKVALLPGGFKPPHAGHYGLAKQLSLLPDIDEVIIIIGKKPRQSETEPKITVTSEQSKHIWDLYTQNDPNISVRVQEGKTPVSDVYDIIADQSFFSEGDTVVLGKSDKDEGDKRYARAQSWAERHNPGVNVEEMVFPIIGGKGMGGTALRNLIASDKKDSFLSMLPEHLASDVKENIWDIVSTSVNFEALDKMIDSAILELSAMGLGSVQGSPKQKNKEKNPYNVWKPRKKDKENMIKRNPQR